MTLQSPSCLASLPEQGGYRIAIEQASAAISPNLVNIERVGDAALRKIIQLILDGDTGTLNGLTVALGVRTPTVMA